jgi:serine/threonine-protein kinase HipA
MKTLEVRYCGWGEDWQLGTLADDGQTLLFEYSAEALAQQLELSPRHLKLRTQAFGDFPTHQLRLPGLIADALPDGWGLLLMDRVFRQRGITPGPLERLAFIGDRAMGALRFVPAETLELPPVDLQLAMLAHETQQVLEGAATDVLMALVMMGGSPHGARPKALVQYQRATAQVSTLATAVGEPWLVKFQAQREHKEVCAIEQLYAQLARECGIDMPESAYFDLGPTLAAFAVARFDRAAGLRVPIHSLAGLLHADFRVPSVDYTTFLRATKLLTRDEREVEKAYGRAVFNVVFHNRDDHAKNFGWRLAQDRRWRLAPAFDLTFCEGPGGQHQSDVCGEGSRITREHLLRLANEGGVDRAAAVGIIERTLEVAGRFNLLATTQPIRRDTAAHMLRAVESNRLLLA